MTSHKRSGVFNTRTIKEHDNIIAIFNTELRIGKPSPLLLRCPGILCRLWPIEVITLRHIERCSRGENTIFNNILNVHPKSITIGKLNSFSDGGHIIEIDIRRSHTAVVQNAALPLETPFLLRYPRIESCFRNAFLPWLPCVRRLDNARPGLADVPVHYFGQVDTAIRRRETLCLVENGKCDKSTFLRCWRRSDDHELASTRYVEDCLPSLHIVISQYTAILWQKGSNHAHRVDVRLVMGGCPDLDERHRHTFPNTSASHVPVEPHQSYRREQFDHSEHCGEWGLACAFWVPTHPVVEKPPPILPDCVPPQYEADLTLGELPSLPRVRPVRLL